MALVFSPLLLGLIVKTKAFFAGRVGAPILQPYYDIAKLWRKGSVFSHTTTWVFRAGPVIGVSTTMLCALMVPLGSEPAPIAFSGDLLLFAYLMGLGRFFTVAAARDTGSPFEGMGAAREATFSALAEPAFLLGLLVLARQAGSTSLSQMLGPSLPSAWATMSAALVLVLAALLVVLLAENSRIPFDDPTTHLELTMVHEVMVLDHSGPAFGIIEYGAALKMFVLGSVVARIALPISTGSQVGDLGIFLGALALLAIGVGVVESAMARLRLLHLPRLLIAACVLSAFGVILAR